MARSGSNAKLARAVTRDDGVASELIVLTALAFAPCFFNVESAQHFEADKAVGIRVLAILALTVEAIRALFRAGMLSSAKALVRGLLRDPAARVASAGVLLVVVSTAVSTVLSVEKHLSFWGGHARRQGAYTVLAYLVLFAVGALRLDAARVRRAVSVVCQSAVAASLYALVQATGNDPIAWAADVTRRPTSTFGNAGALAGYIVVAAPFLVARLSERWGERTATELRSKDLLGAAALGGSHIFLLANVAMAGHSLGWFGEPLRLAIAIAIATASWALPDARGGTERRGFANAVLVLALGWSVVVAAGAAGAHAPLTAGLAWCAIGLGAMVAWACRERRASDEGGAASRGATRGMLAPLAYGLALLGCIVVLVLTRARGAQAALFVTMLVFVNAWLFRRHAPSAPRTASRRRRLGVAALQGVALACVLFFNLSTLPLVERMRGVPYLGRLGQWLATGEVNAHARIVIWTGDAYGAGVRGLVFASPLRTVFGYGPETFREVFAATFPPSFLYGTGHGVTPDRAHQAALDVLVTQGVVGLIALTLVFGGFLVMAAREAAAARSDRERTLAVACLAAIVAHLVDGAAGLPTTASMFTCWMTFALVASLGRVEGASVRLTNGATRTLRDRWGVALLLGSAGVVAAWTGNVSSIVADMFQHAGSPSSPDASLAFLVTRCEATSKAIALAPRDGVYATELGQTLLLMGERVRGGERAASTSALSACGRLATGSAQDLVLRARDALTVAERLEPRDKDRPANVGQANLVLYQETGDAAALDHGVAAYRRARALAPNDVLLGNALAAALAQRQDFAEAEQLLERSLDLDPELMETRLQLADLWVLEGRIDESVSLYERVLRESPSTLWTPKGSRAASIVKKLGGEPRRLRRLEAALAAHIDQLRRDQRAAPLAEQRDADEEIAFEERMQAVFAARGL